MENFCYKCPGVCQKIIISKPGASHIVKTRKQGSIILGTNISYINTFHHKFITQDNQYLTSANIYILRLDFSGMIMIQKHH